MGEFTFLRSVAQRCRGGEFLSKDFPMESPVLSIFLKREVLIPTDSLLVIQLAIYLAESGR